MGTIKCECAHTRTFDSRKQAAIEIFKCLMLLQQFETALGAGIHEPVGVRGSTCHATDRHVSVACKRNRVIFT